MKALKLVTILLKLIAFYIFTQFLLMLPASLRGLMITRSAANNLVNVPDESFTSMFGFLFVMAGVYLLFSIGLYFAAPKLSCFLVEDKNEEVSLSGSVSNNLQTWSFRCFGIYALVTWGPNLVQTFCQTIIYGTWQLDQIPFLRRFYDNWSVLISPVAGVLFGLLLIFKAKGLVRLIQFSRPMSRQYVELENKGNDLQPSVPSNPHSPSAQGSDGR